MIINVKDADHYNELINKGKYIVKLGADWCQPCKSVDSALEILSLETDANILKVNVDEHPDIAGQLRIMSIPVTILFDENENEVKRSNGFKPTELEEIINLSK